MRKGHRFLLAIALMILVNSTTLPGQKNFVPPPIRLHAPFEVVWDEMNRFLEDKGFEIIQRDRGRGTLLTGYREYISGLLTQSHIGKIGEKPRLIDGEWEQIRYQYEIRLQLISGKETVLTVYTNIEALSRQYLGGEERVRIQTNGKLEEKLLGEFGKSLFGEGFSLERPKKGFWERDPAYLPDPGTQNPPIAGPERQR